MVETEKLTKKLSVLVPLREGEIAEGKVIGVAKSAAYLDLGPSGTGIIYGQEFKDAKDFLKDLKVGDSIWAKVLSLDSDEGYIELSLSQAKKEMVWKELEEKRVNSEPLKVRVSGANKGGLLAEIFGIPAFLPVSQLSSKHYPKIEGGDKLRILKELQKFIGQELEIKILDLDPRQRKLILSEKAGRVEELKEMLKNYKVGDVVKGKITAVVDFGAFIAFPVPACAEAAEDAADVKEEKPESEEPAAEPAEPIEETCPEPIEGLIHISELDWGLVQNPGLIVRPGQIVEAKIVEIADNKVALSIKALKPKPAVATHL